MFIENLLVFTLSIFVIYIKLGDSVDVILNKNEGYLELDLVILEYWTI